MHATEDKIGPRIVLYPRYPAVRDPYSGQWKCARIATAASPHRNHQEHHNHTSYHREPFLPSTLRWSFSFIACHYPSSLLVRNSTFIRAKDSTKRRDLQTLSYATVVLALGTLGRTLPSKYPGVRGPKDLKEATNLTGNLTANRVDCRPWP